jgi:hypothetical protein
MSIRDRIERIERGKESRGCTQPIIHTDGRDVPEVKCDCGGVHIIEAVKPQEV